MAHHKKLYLRFRNQLITTLTETCLPALKPINSHDLLPPYTVSDISDHLTTLFSETIKINPSLIVELGVRSGQSTRAFISASKYTHSKILSVDLDSCEDVQLQFKQNQNWHFIQSDDLMLAQKLIDK